MRQPWSPSDASSAWSATTTWRSSASSTSRPSLPRPPPPSAGRATSAKPATLEFLRRPRAGRREPRGGPLPRLPARPGVGVRAVARPGGRVHRHPGRAGEPGRALARGPVLRHARGPGAPGRRRAARSSCWTPRGAPRPAAAPGSTSPRDAGWSTPAASDSPATATREPPGSSSTPMPGRPPTTGSTTRSIAPPRRSPPPTCPSTWPGVCTWASEPGCGNRRGDQGSWRVSALTRLAAMPGTKRLAALIALAAARRGDRRLRLGRDRGHDPADERRSAATPRWTHVEAASAGGDCDGRQRRGPGLRGRSERAARHRRHRPQGGAARRR